jgi:hypothetical protein
MVICALKSNKDDMGVAGNVFQAYSIIMNKMILENKNNI